MHVEEVAPGACERSYYEALGLSFLASDSEIRTAFRRLALRFHPDRQPCDRYAAQRFHEIVAAYEVLSDPAMREVYDRSCQHWLCVEEYLKEFGELLLTVSGLGLRTSSAGGSMSDAALACRAQQELDSGAQPAGMLTAV